MDKFITVNGVNTNNLKNISVRLPKGKITALVGVSGAGKTSLAFDTIYAEGYLRYIESISPYVRQFLDKLEKPAVESIDGLPPAIAFRHKKPAKNPRSIVATSLDIFDYLRILYAKVSDFHCPTCGKKIKMYSIDEMIAEILEHFDGKLHVCFEYSGDVAFLINRGYYFHIFEGEKKRIDHTVKDTSIRVLIDGVDIKKENKSRLFEALDRSIAFGKTGALVFHEGREKLFPSDLYCSDCDVRYPPPDEHLFSFNSPKGACPGCKGFGDIQTLDRSLLFDPARTLAEGAVLPFNTPATRRYKNALLNHAEARGIDLHQPVGALCEADLHFLVEGGGKSRGFGGIKRFFDRLKSKSYKIQARVFLSRYTTYVPCPQCNAGRLNALARGFTVNGVNLADFLRFSIGEARDFMLALDAENYRHKISADVFSDIRSRLDYLVESGLAYIGLNRSTYTLSRGEFQRINLAFILGSTLSDSLLIIDQPSSDLHPNDYGKLEKFLLNLKANGNTVLLVEHNRDIVRICDHVLELGPRSGESGGRVVFDGSKERFFNFPDGEDTLTRTCFREPPAAPAKEKTFSRWHTFTGAGSHNLNNFDFKIPADTFTVITGVSGAGKTTLLYDEIYRGAARRTTGGRDGVKDVVFIDPGIGNLRSNTITAGYFDLYPAIRELFAQLKESRVGRFTPGHFSFNSPRGRCDQCEGKGHVEVEMQFLPAVRVVCDTCGGKGFKPDVLKIRYRERNIRETLDLSVAAFAEAAGGDLPPKKRDILTGIVENGLGYVKLGQPLKTLSTGELQRVKLIKHLNAKKTGALFLIDEPSFGLHDHDVEMVKKLIRRIISNKNTVVAAEHNLRLIAISDYMVELGPGGGNDGGRLIYQGSTAEAAGDPDSITGFYLKKIKKTLDKSW